MAPGRRPRPAGWRAIVAGLVLVDLAVLAIAAGAIAWTAFRGPDTGDAEAFAMPGGITKDLSAGEWGLYTEIGDGSQRVAPASEVNVEGPGAVRVEATGGPEPDTTAIDVDGADYRVFLRLRVPLDGRYDISVAGAGAQTTPVIIGHYDDDGVVEPFVIAMAALAVLTGLPGVAVLVAGLVRRSRGRRVVANPPSTGPPAPGPA